MRQHFVLNKREEIQMRTRKEEAADEEPNSMSILFLNSLEPPQPVQFYEEMVRYNKCVKHINLKHIQPTLTNADELEKMTGRKDRDGKLY